MDGRRVLLLTFAVHFLASTASAGATLVLRGYVAPTQAPVIDTDRSSESTARISVGLDSNSRAGARILVEEIQRSRTAPSPRQLAAQNLLPGESFKVVVASSARSSRSPGSAAERWIRVTLTTP